jgi:hypothetical protein
LYVSIIIHLEVININVRNFNIPIGFHFQNGRHNTAQIQHCSISRVAFNLFFKPVVSGRFGRLHHIKLWWYRTMFNFCGIVAAILKMVIGRNFSMSGINSGHHYLPTYEFLMISDNVELLPPFLWSSSGHHFQNGRHNTAQIQHCPISTTFHMLVDYDVPNRFLLLKNFYRSPFQNGHHNTNLTIMKSPKPATDNRFKK